MYDESELSGERRRALQLLRVAGQAYPNRFQRDALAGGLRERYGGMSREQLLQENVVVRIAGRMMSRRVMGRAAFAHVQDMSDRIQLYVRQDNLSGESYERFLEWDLGDIIGASGSLMQTKRGELSVEVSGLTLLCKSLRPLPEKFHGLTNQETRYRRRYLDLLCNADARRIFALRSRVIQQLRNFLLQRDFIEVETPMMHPIPGGAAARPFVTHHNSLGLDLYLRIAPELYLKRLVVGGMEQIFEINRSFRNEGLSTRHNPEFTMLEFYQAYATYEDLMALSETLMRELVTALNGSPVLRYQGRDYDFSKTIPRMTMLEAICQHNPSVSSDSLRDPERIKVVAGELQVPVEDGVGLGRVQLEIFEKTVEEKLLQPVFITAYPAEVSPLARCSDVDPAVAERFEFFVGGREIANGFSELNDPEEQARRFRRQTADQDAEAMRYDADYITALEYGMPPTAGEGIGIDRLVMLLADVASIREVILFPQLRPKGSVSAGT